MVTHNASGKIRVLTGLLIMLAGCHTLPEGVTLRAAFEGDKAPDKQPAKAQASAKTGASNRPGTLQAADSATGQGTALPSASPSASASASDPPAFLYIIPHKPGESPTIPVLPAEGQTPPPEWRTRVKPPEGPQISFHVRFSAPEAELSAHYLVRVMLEKHTGDVFKVLEVFPDQLAKGITLSSGRFSQGDPYQIRIQGQNFDGKCLGRAHFLLKDSGRSVSGPEHSLLSEDFVASEAGEDCQKVLNLVGQVVDGRGNGLVGARVEASWFSTHTQLIEYRARAVTDNQGKYSFSSFPPNADVRISASLGGYQSTTKTLSLEYGPNNSVLYRSDRFELRRDTDF